MFDAHSCDVHIFISSHDSLKTARTSSTLCSSCAHIRRSTFLGFWNALPGVAFFQLVAEPSVADCGMRHELQLSRVIGTGLRRDPEVHASECLKEAARIVELEREKEQLEDDLLACLGKIDQMQKKIGEMTLNENHDAEFIAKVMKERDRVLAERVQHSEEARKAFKRARGVSREPCDARMQSLRPCADRRSRRKRRTRVWKWTEMFY